jgi:hypothetical protein
MEGRRIQVVREMNRNQAVKDSRLEFKEAWKEYNEVFDTLKKETTEFVLRRSKDLKFREHREYLQKTIQSVKRSIRDFATEKGPQYIGAFTEMTAEHRHYFTRRWYNEHVFGITSWRSSNRIAYPTLRIGLYNLKEE